VSVCKKKREKGFLTGTPPGEGAKRKKGGEQSNSGETSLYGKKAGAEIWSNECRRGERNGGGVREQKDNSWRLLRNAGGVRRRL